MEISVLVAGLAIGLTIGTGFTWYFLKKQGTDAARAARAEGQIEAALLKERLGAALEEGRRVGARLAESETQRGNDRRILDGARSQCAQLAEKASRIPVLEEELKKEAQRRDQLLAELQRLTRQLSEVSTMLDAERKQTGEKLALLHDSRELLSNQFKSLASEILEEKSKRFTEQNQANIGQLLEPLKVKLSEFQGKVEQVYVQEGKERTALAEQVRQLMALNKQLSDDAHNLTRALKGSNKAQGNWGEMILEKILESSGLRKGHEYDVQESHAREDGSRVQPDVVIHLPQDRHIVVDAKVSLVGYEEYVTAEEKDLQEAALKRHLDSVRLHIRGLAEKHYEEIHGVKSLDFVVMFIPIEPAFMVAISQDGELWQSAWNRNVLLVSPSTLLFVLRTVAHVWRQEQHSKNAQEIAKKGADLYEKLVGFVDDLVAVGAGIKGAQASYDKAFRKFAEGRGNAIRQAEMLKELGVRPKKDFPTEILEGAGDELLPLGMEKGGELGTLQQS